MSKTKQSVAARIKKLSLARDTRGALTTEYVSLVGFMFLALLAALLSVGPYLVEHYQLSRNIVASPYP